MITNKRVENEIEFICNKCDFKCYYNSDYNRHTATAKHKMITNDNIKTNKNEKSHTCVCGRKFIYSSGLSRHRKNCLNNNRSIVITNEHQSMMDIITQNKELMDLLVLQNKELTRQNKEQSDTIGELIPRIGNNNTITTNNQFNLNAFLNDDCKEALNFSDFIENIKVSFQDLENQAEHGYIKGITKIFLDNLQELGTNKRPIHCTDKKRKTIYIKENDIWDKEGSQDTLKKGIQEITRRTMQTLMKEKDDNQVEYSNMDSEFSLKCVDIQRNLIPQTPREITIEKVIGNISDNTRIVDTQNNTGNHLL
jgi:hypothetical protein